MTIVSRDGLLAAIASVRDPLLGESYDALDAIGELALDGSKARLNIRLGMLPSPEQQRSQSLLKQALQQAGVTECEVRIDGAVMACPDRNRSGHLKAVKNVVMVASGKGGVGKSTTAINLALALANQGAQVGLLDADIYGPSLRTMLGISDELRPVLVENRFIHPIEAMGLKTMSIAYMSSARTPMIWRGSMAVRALTQLVEQTIWGELDYLIIDMPPGTGDIQISLAQQLRISGAVIVTTPQEVALIDARKGIEMFNKTGVPVLGVVENMATHVCSACGHEEAIFGAHGAEQMATEYGVRVLGSLPLNGRIRADVDNGLPTVARDPAGAIANAYFALAYRMAATLWQSNFRRGDLPQIVVLEE